MLSGFPFRMVNELQGAYSQFAKLVGGMMQTPHPQSPDLPMAADPRLDLTPYLYRTLEALQKEMSYAGRYRPIDPTDEPSTRSRRTEQLRGGSSSSSTGGSNTSANSTSSVPGGYELPPSSTTGSPQLPISPYSVRPPIPTSGSPTGESMGIGLQQGNRGPERTSPIPVPGSTVSNGSDSTVFPGELRTNQRPGYATIGSPDLASQPDLIAQLFPNLFESLLGAAGPNPGSGRNERRKPSGDGRIRDRGSSSTKPVRSKSRRDAG